MGTLLAKVHQILLVFTAGNSNPDGKDILPFSIFRKKFNLFEQKFNKNVYCILSTRTIEYKFRISNYSNFQMFCTLFVLKIVN